MGDTMHLDESTVNQILELLREAGPAVFAAPEDADYFRKSTKPLPPEPKKSEPVFIPPQPAPQPAPQPPKPEVIFAPPPPPPPIPPPVKLQPLEPKPPSDLSSIRAILSVVAPELKILNEIPSDAIAKKISERWKTKNQTAPISILLYQEPPEQRVLLEQIAKALDVYFGPAKIVSAETIEKEKQWEAFLSVADLKMVIVCDYTLWQLNGLMHFYKETPAQGIRQLGQAPLFLLPDLSLYLKDPLLKRSLWKALCQKFS